MRLIIFFIIISGINLNSQDRIFTYTHQSNVLNTGNIELEIYNTFRYGKENYFASGHKSGRKGAHDRPFPRVHNESCRNNGGTPQTEGDIRELVDNPEKRGEDTEIEGRRRPNTRCGDAIRR